MLLHVLNHVKLSIVSMMMFKEMMLGMMTFNEIMLKMMMFAFVLHFWARFRLLPFLEGLYPLPRHQYRDHCSVELRKVIRGIVVGARYHVRPEPSPCKLSRRPVLISEVVVIDEHQVALLYLP